MGRVLEICVADPSGTGYAQAAGADRVELCAALNVGGLTPSPGQLQAALKQGRLLDITVLVRPRAGNFCYDHTEQEIMLADMELLLEHAHAAGRGNSFGITTGALNKHGEVDEDFLSTCVETAWGSPVTFHRAFDSLLDPFRGLTTLAACGVARVLTAGGAGPATANLAVLRDLVAAGKELGIQVIVCGGLRPGPQAGASLPTASSDAAANINSSLLTVAHATQADAYHFNAATIQPARQPTLGNLWQLSAYDDGTLQLTDPALVRQARTQLDSLDNLDTLDSLDSPHRPGASA